MFLVIFGCSTLLNTTIKDARVCLIPDYMETHTITTYRLASDKFLRTYFPESAYGLTPSMKFKRRKS